VNPRWAVAVLSLLVIAPTALAADADPRIYAAQQGNKTVIMLSGNWTENVQNAGLDVLSSERIEGARSSNWWEIAQQDEKSLSFSLSRNENKSSVFVVHSNASAPKFQYQLNLNNTNYSGEIVPVNNSGQNWFSKWTDSGEGAMLAYIPEGWKADLQIIRPYDSMTGFVFFVRGEANTLAYVFYPFMPLHVLPDEGICEELEICSGLASGEKVAKASFGNAPVSVSAQLQAAEYFERDVVPLLRANLEGYSISSAEPAYALLYDDENRPEMQFVEGLDVMYSFDANGKKILGKSIVLISNHTEQDAGYWNGVILGVEAGESDFDDAFQKASVTMLTLKLDEKWMTDEQAVLDRGAESTVPALRNLSRTISNNTLAEFDSILSTAAHALVRSYDGSKIGSFNNTATNRELHLPIFDSIRYWYLEDDRLLGREAGRNLMNSTDLELLYR
jgi:hypothetical protein